MYDLIVTKHNGIYEKKVTHSVTSIQIIVGNVS